jgi:ectoine hydroxylase-related dioxygenase (phytanoyl-CoA dioxygenase family)
MEASVANGGRAKRKSAQTAQDAQLARALQEEIIKGNRGKKPKCEELGIDLKADEKQEKQCARIDSPKKCRAGGAASARTDLHDVCGGEPLLRHWVKRNSAGFLEADARRGCCVCDECAQRLADEMIKGSGIVVIRGAISEEAAAHARSAVNKLSVAEAKAGRRVEGELGPSHRRIWNLLNEGPPFTTLITHNLVFKVFSRVIGADFVLGSFSANEIGANCPQGPAHVDYPYSMLQSFPTDPMACQAIFCLDEWSAAKGATRVQLHSQKLKEHPDRDQHLETVVEGHVGDLVMYNSLLHHRSGPNSTRSSRIGLLGQFLAKYVRPMEDQRSVSEKVKKMADKRLRQLLALDCPFPILDPTVGTSCEIYFPLIIFLFFYSGDLGWRSPRLKLN